MGKTRITESKRLWSWAQLFLINNYLYLEEGNTWKQLTEKPYEVVVTLFENE
jgi:hypothetical protein